MEDSERGERSAFEWMVGDAKSEVIREGCWSSCCWDELAPGWFDRELGVFLPV